MADFFKWDPALLSVHVGSMDQEHIELIKRMNALHLAQSQGKPKEILAGLVDSFAQFTIQHFADEEAYMEKIQFEGLTTHRVIHQNLLKEVTKHIEAFKLSGTLTDSFFQFLSVWLTSHIRGIDMKYGAKK